MIRCFTLAIAAVGAFASARFALAGDFEIQAKAEVADRHVETTATVETPSSKPAQPRPVVKLACDQPVWLSWHAVNTSKSREFPDVLMHYYIVEEDHLGQAEVTKLTQDVTCEGALTTDFKPHDKADWRVSVHIHEPGNYIFRVETIGLDPTHRHERYAAMDLIVK
jgi:hypothetical protein